MFTAPAKVGAESFFGVGSYESNVLKFSPAFGDTHTLVQESFRPPLRIRTHPLSKVFDQTFFKKFDGSRVVTLDNGLSFCKAFSLAFCFKEKALKDFREAKVLPLAT